MNRLGLLQPSSLNDSQKQAYQVFDQESPSRLSKLVYSKDEDGCLLGPAGALIHSPEMLEHCLGLQRAISNQFDQTGLPRYIQELTSLVVGARTQAAYEIYAHSRNSGFPQKYLDDIRDGSCPPELDAKGQIAFEIAAELGNPGVLSETTWQRSIHILGVDGTAAVVHCVGFYNFLSTIANGFDVQLPAAYVSETSVNSSPRSSISLQK